MSWQRPPYSQLYSHTPLLTTPIGLGGPPTWTNVNMAFRANAHLYNYQRYRNQLPMAGGSRQYSPNVSNIRHNFVPMSRVPTSHMKRYNEDKNPYDQNSKRTRLSETSEKDLREESSLQAKYENLVPYNPAQEVRYFEFDVSDKISTAIYRHFEKQCQTDAHFMKKINLRDALFSIIKEVFAYSGLYIVGSSMSGFATVSSDMDLCLMITEGNVSQNRVAPEILHHIRKSFSRCSFLRDIVLIRAKVPILRFTDKVSNVECDLNINNSVGIRNTHLLKYYAMIEPRLKPLMLYVKKWARYHDINDASKATISSYSLSLMVINYLQVGCDPPVLPCLQALYPAVFSPKQELTDLKWDHELVFRSENKQSIGDIFLGFLKYYALDFEFEKNVVSVGSGTVKDLKYVSSHPREDGWNKELKIEEPFEKTNTARSCYDSYVFLKVKRVFRTSFSKLRKTMDPEVLFQAPF